MDNNTVGLLGTAQFRIVLPGPNHLHPIRALMDPGSQLNLITEHCVQHLKLIRVNQQIWISGVGTSTHINGFVDIKLINRNVDAASVTARVHIVSKISNHVPDNRPTLWGRRQKLQQDFWRRFQDEYFSNLQQKANLKINDMVIIKDDHSPPAACCTGHGRVIETFKEADGFVRAAKTKTAATKLERSIQKLAFFQSR